MKSFVVVAVSLLAAGCAVTATEKGPEPTSPVEQTAPPSAPKGPSEAPIVLPTETAPNVDANLARLRDLKIFTVGELIVNAPQTGNCYGPCPEDIAKAKLEAAQKLQTFADTVVAESKLAPVSGVTQTETDANLTTLRALKIVDVGDLIVEQPKNNPNCYNFPCQEDIEAAQAINDARAGQLANVAKAF